MAATWESVVSNPQYQALPPAQQEAARQQYFDSVVAPNVPKDHLDFARQQFDNFSATKTQSAPSFSNNMIRDINNEIMRPNASGIGMAAGVVSDLGKEATSRIPGVKQVGSAIQSADEAGQQFVQPLANAISPYTDKPIAAVSDYIDQSPGLRGVLGDMKNIAGAGATLSAVDSLRSTLGDIGENAATSLARPEGNFPQARAVRASDFNPLATHSAISDAYGAAKEATKPYYNLMHDVASGEVADASELKPALQSMIEDIQNTPFHEAQSELPYLKQQMAKISSDGTMSLNEMVKLKQNLNSNFNPKRFAIGSDTPYSVVSGLVDDSLADAAKRVPDFGEAKSLADKNWLNTVKAPFEDNKVLQKIWKPEDYYAKKSVDSGMLEELPDPTKQRAATMLKHIKNPVQLDAVRRVIPQPMSDALSVAKIQDITQGGGLSRASAAGKAIIGAPNIITPSGIRNTFTNIGEAIGGVPYNEQEKALLEALKAPAPSLSTKYQRPFQNLKGLRQQEMDSAAEMQPFQYSKPSPPPKLITYQPSNMSVPSEGPSGTILMNPTIRESLGQSPSTIAERTPADVLRAQEAAAQGQSGILRKYGANRISEGGNFTEVPEKGNPGSMGNAALIQAEKQATTQAGGDAWNALSPQEKADAIKTVIKNEIQRQKIAPENETEMARKFREAGFKKGGPVKKPRNLTAEFLGRKYA